ncbi:DUF2188 domain-containing protein [Stenotrophomonas sp. PS02289]|uniref:DUF2188 domain-containing protein n=1 Tax=Stenotrophomonas sp. PS02289 TaxID=2991422 RepID=UPI00249A7B11|nr:DUF2188 domain-containing protein [Stenotrophomonas sp. PS02289]
MTKKDIHVVPHTGGWAVKKEGGERASSVHRTQADALEQARDQGRRDKVEVVIHGRDGKIRDSDSYGSDPSPPKDKVR